jgi:hypothetical protein
MLTRSGGSASSKPEVSFIAQLKRPHLVQVLSMQGICPALLGRLKDTWLAIGDQLRAVVSQTAAPPRFGPSPQGRPLAFRLLSAVLLRANALKRILD